MLTTETVMAEAATLAQPTPGLDTRYFNDPAIYDAVRDQLYFKTWQYACHSSQVANPSDYFSFSLFEQDLMITHDQNGEVQALYNVCQHRGHKLVEGSGNKRVIICPYHQWAYQLDGQLRGAPNSKNVPGFDASKICVPKVRVENFLGFIFVNLDENAAPMDECYPSVREAILNLCPDIEQRQFAHEKECEEYCNWLVAVENYNECYHCKGVHKQFAEGIIDPGSYNIAPFGAGKVLNHSSKPSDSDGAWYDTSGSDYGSFYLWPSTSIQIYPGGVVNNYYWRPLGVDNTRVHRGWFSDDGQVDETLQKVIDLDWTTTVAEDLDLVKSVQRGLQSKGYRPGPLVIDPNGGIESELSIAKLHEWMREAVKGA